MTHDEEENAVRQLGELIGYRRLIQHARALMEKIANSGLKENLPTNSTPTDTGSVT